MRVHLAGGVVDASQANGPGSDERLVSATGLVAVTALAENPLGWCADPWVKAMPKIAAATTANEVRIPSAMRVDSDKRDHRRRAPRRRSRGVIAGRR
jgi:hypothetical protein